MPTRSEGSLRRADAIDEKSSRYDSDLLSPATRKQMSVESPIVTSRVARQLETDRRP